MGSVETCVPPPPVPGCPGGSRCLVCNPLKSVGDSEEKWTELKAKWAEQQRSPFVLYKLVKRDPEAEGGARDVLPEELDDVEQRSTLAHEWARGATERGWVKEAIAILKKVKAAQKDVRSSFGQPVPRAVVDYHLIIFHAQDLGSIETGLREGRFATPDEWIAAMRTVFRNAFVYNRPSEPFGAIVLAAADAASLVFEKEILRLRGIVVV